MANFKTALEALGARQISLEAISQQLSGILGKTPDYSHHLLSLLIEAKESNILDEELYQHLNTIIEPYLLDSHPINISENPVRYDFINIEHNYSGDEITTGTIIKQRFKLLEILGIGGMGRVFRGIDLLKQEARDKNPYVAIKLLNEDFKTHPKAFISLQRESSRQQKLAHPNIATVYDFDRVGGPGSPVFITMELLEGQTLNTFIKTKLRRRGGLSFNESFKIIKQLASALSYAHERGIVHSDFKPGNAFICNDGTVKTLDFGIARAVKNPLTGEAEKTLFDPRNLGAYTPAYASLEMLLGKAPDTRDDIYALGCVSYEILTGRHPFNKMPATEVKEKELIPESVRDLKRKQNITLRSALACEREDRCQTVEKFITDLEAKYIWYKSKATIAAIFAMMIGVSLFSPIQNHLQEKKINAITSGINTGKPGIIQKKLIELGRLKQANQLIIATNAKSAIQNYFSNEINKLTNINSDTYHFPEATKLLISIEEMYPDSSFLEQQQQQVKINQNELLSQLYAQLTESIKDRETIHEAETILTNLRDRIDPQHPLLEDPSIANAFLSYAGEALEKENIGQAAEMLAKGLNVFPNDLRLQDMNNQINKHFKIQSLHQSLGFLTKPGYALHDYKDKQADIHNLAILNFDDILLGNLAYDVQQLSKIELLKISETGNSDDAKVFAKKYSKLLNSLRLENELIQIKLAHLSGEDYIHAIQSIIEENTSEVEKLISAPMINDFNWNFRLDNKLHILESLSGEPVTQPVLAPMLDKLAELYVIAANETLSENRFDTAKQYIQKAEQYSPQNNSVIKTHDAIDQMATEHKKELKISTLKNEFEALTQANKTAFAKILFYELKLIIPADNFYITTIAPKRLSESLDIIAKQAAESGRLYEALNLAREGLELYPLNQNLKTNFNEYLLETNVMDISNELNNNISFNIDTIRHKFREIETINPGRYLELRQSIIDKLIERINSIKEKDINQSVILAQNAESLFPDTEITQLLQTLKPQPWPEKEYGDEILAVGRYTEALEIEQNARKAFANHPNFILFSNRLKSEITTADELFNEFLATKKNAGDNYQKLLETEPYLVQAQSKWTDNPKYEQAAIDLEKLITSNKPLIQPEVLQHESTDFIAAEKETQLVWKNNSTHEWQPVSSGRECESQYASYGKRAKAICFDLVNDNWRGPLMVVIPPGTNIQQIFAISKYEISVNDYSKYCVISAKCKPLTDGLKQDDPMRNISFQQATDYARWLSQRTGKKYRIPTSIEWEHAAFAAGQQPEMYFNCRLAFGNKLVRGADIVSIKSGKSNGWGLKNHIGNVQEWVLDDSKKLQARGGAFSDTHSKCTISLTRLHNGEADEITGFRLILEDIQ